MAVRTLTLLQINDTHGYLMPHPELFWEGSRAVYRSAGGFARLRTRFEDVRAEQPGAVLALDNGDTFHGTFPAVHTQGEALVAPLRLLGLDAMTGHWDFAYGPERLRHLIDRLGYPLLAANSFDRATAAAAFPRTLVVERAGLRVGIVGLAAAILDKTMPPRFSEGLRFTLGTEVLPGVIDTLREEAHVDLVVVLSHLGFPQDVKLAGEVAGIDVLLSGHTHNRLHAPVQVGRTAIIQSGCHGAFIGRLDVEVDSGAVRVARHRLIPVDDTVIPDGEMDALVTETVAPFRAMLDEVVGETATALHRNTVLEAPMDTLLLRAIAGAAGTAIAFSNGWRYGAPIPPGPVTMNDLFNIIPSNPPVSTVVMTGAEMHAMMEENLEHTFAADPYRQMGGYVKRVHGLHLYVKLENPRGTRIQAFFAEGRPVERDRRYPVAFVTEQGVPKAYGEERRSLSVHAVEALRDYLRRHGRVHIEAEGTVVAV